MTVTQINHSFVSNVLLVALLLLISACTPFMGSIERPQGDRAPTVTVDPNTIRDATPREDVITRAGNRNPYTVLGKTYHLLPTSKGYRKEGIASWYGKKFQGRPTANGERYNLYAMTAAHKTLPIPAYVKVTNLDNNRTAIVRVNDRGPFHDQRIIDLSYAAAVKLGYAKKGTARVRVEAIDTTTPIITKTPIAATSSIDTQRSDNNLQSNQSDRYFLQVAAFKSLTSANALRAELLLSTSHDISIQASDPVGFYRVQIGPLMALDQVEQESNRLVAMGKGRPRLISR